MLTWPLAQMQGWGAGRSEILVRLSCSNPVEIQSLQGQKNWGQGGREEVPWTVELESAPTQHLLAH